MFSSICCIFFTCKLSVQPVVYFFFPGPDSSYSTYSPVSALHPASVSFFFFTFNSSIPPIMSHFHIFPFPNVPFSFSSSFSSPCVSIISFLHIYIFHPTNHVSFHIFLYPNTLSSFPTSFSCSRSLPSRPFILVSIFTFPKLQIFSPFHVFAFPSFSLHPLSSSFGPHGSS